MDEKKLIRNILSGDLDAFAELVEAYEKQVYNLCYRMCGNEEDAKDLTQEAFVKVWRGLEHYQFESAFSTWLYRLTSNVCIDFLRRRKRQNTVSLFVSREEDGETELEPPDQEPLPEEQLLQRERRQAIERAMGQLEEEFRLVLTLRVIHDMPYEQIAQITNVKVGTVKSRLARARSKLKKILVESGNNFFPEASKKQKGGELP